MYKTKILDDEVLMSLSPNAPFGLTGVYVEFVEKDVNGVKVMTTPNLQWFDESIPKPTKEQIETERARLQAELDATEYQRQRALEYPPLTMLADALYHQQNGDETKMQDYLAAVQAVKDKYPKG